MERFDVEYLQIFKINRHLFYASEIHGKLTKKSTNLLIRSEFIRLQTLFPHLISS